MIYTRLVNIFVFAMFQEKQGTLQPCKCLVFSDNNEILNKKKT